MQNLAKLESWQPWSVSLSKSEVSAGQNVFFSFFFATGLKGLTVFKQKHWAQSQTQRFQLVAVLDSCKHQRNASCPSRTSCTQVAGRWKQNAQITQLTDKKSWQDCNDAGRWRKAKRHPSFTFKVRGTTFRRFSKLVELF